MSLSNAVLIRIISFIFSILWIVLLSFGLPIESGDGSEGVAFSWHAFLIATQDPMYPFNLQVMMWVAFFFCLGELMIHWLNISEQNAHTVSFSLYQNPNVVVVKTEQGDFQIALNKNEALKPEILAAIYRAKKEYLPDTTLIGHFFKTINYQFHSSNSVADVYSALTSAIELKLHQVELRYTVVKYLAWLIPTLGFIGTVIGIAVALGQAGAMGSSDPNLLAEVVPLLATAFYTTLLALLLSAIVMVLIQVIQAKDETTVNDVATFCLDNIVRMLKERKE